MGLSSPGGIGGFTWLVISGPRGISRGARKLGLNIHGYQKKKKKKKNSINSPLKICDEEKSYIGGKMIWSLFC